MMEHELSHPGTPEQAVASADELSIQALTQQLQEQAKIIALREEAITWLQNELAIARDEVRSVKGSKFWKLRQVYFRARKFFSPLRELFPRSRRAWSRSVSVPGRGKDSASALSFRASSQTACPASPYATLRIQPTLPTENDLGLEQAASTFSAPRRVDIICFSIIDWSFRYQRPQQIMSQFAAQGHRVFFISPGHFLSPHASPRVRVRPLRANLYAVSLAAARAPQIYREEISGLNGELLLESLAALRDEFQIDQAVSYVMIASWNQVALEARKRWGWWTLYDCMDEWENFPGVSHAVVKIETELAQACDLLVVTATKLWNKWQSLNRPMVLARNGVDYAAYAARIQPNLLLQEIAHPIIGYFGAIADWFELDWVVYAARQRPQYTFVLLGGIFEVDVSKLRALSNVRLLSQQPYETMPQYLYHFDVCIIPFKRNATTEATDPVKLYEYFSAGRPVVSAMLPEIEPYRDLIYFAQDQTEFVAQLDTAVAEADASRVAARRAMAQQNTWRTRYEQIMAGIQRVVPRVSIIVVTYNNLALTRLCVAAILGGTAYPNYELILVDNHSTDTTPEYLSGLAAHAPNVKVILNAENRGFAAANNQGLQAASGDYLILLNNDTIVPPGGVHHLTQHLRAPHIGLVGPTTNFAGNEAKLDVPYSTWQEMNAYARERYASFHGARAELQVVAMFCVAMRREVYQEIGPLDEQFGIGLFEDDDYAMRVRQKGYRVVCALDTFVHHFGQAAFRHLIREGRYDLLFSENLRRYEAKWQVKWIPHRHGQLTPVARANAGH